VPCFAFGCAVLLAWRTRAFDRRDLALGALAASLAGVVGLSMLGGPDAAIVCLFGVVILSLAGLSHSGGGWLSSPFAVWLGEISYSVYMVCVPWKLLFPNLAAKALGLEGDVLPLWAWLVFLTAVVPIAGLSHHLIERPARGYLRSLSARLFGERPR